MFKHHSLREPHDLAVQIITKEGDMILGRHVYGPFLLLLPPEQLAVITLFTVMTAMMEGTTLASTENFRVKSRQAGVAKLISLTYDVGKVRTSALCGIQQSQIWFSGRLITYDLVL
jgi:DNA-directed RNA polymerase